jgi:hypothetical protein
MRDELDGAWAVQPLELVHGGWHTHPPLGHYTSLFLSFLGTPGVCDTDRA